MLCTVYREHRKSTRETAGDNVVDNMETTSLSQWTKVSGFTRSVLVLVFYFIVCSCILGINFNVQKMLACMVAGGPAVDFIHPPNTNPNTTTLVLKIDHHLSFIAVVENGRTTRF